MRVRIRHVALLTVVAASAVAVALHRPVPQDVRYHSFADRRTILGVPNFWNVVSNAAFVAAGIAGLRALRRGGPPGAPQPMYPAWTLLFAGIVMVGFGSAWYHLAPNHDRLTWDRLPMTVVFTSFAAMVIGEWIDPRVGRRVLPPLLLAGLLSVIHWEVSEGRGKGDLRAYMVVQFLPMVLVPLVILEFPARGVKPRYIWGALTAYAAAKVLEFFDAEVLETLRFASGHTLKHLAAAVAAYSLVRAGKREEIAEEARISVAQTT